MKKLLIVEDDVYISDMLLEKLTREGYEVQRAFSGTEALLALEKDPPDLILLDLMLPGMSGEEVLARISDIPVMIISAKSDVSGKVEALLNGANDYITKPFDMDELSARIAVQLRLSEGRKPGGRLVYDEITLTPDSREISVSGESVRLTRTEFAILKRLMLNPDVVVTRSHLLDMISDDTPDCTESTLKVHISNLRGKLREKSGKDYIEAVWGIGFKMRKV